MMRARAQSRLKCRNIICNLFLENLNLMEDILASKNERLNELYTYIRNNLKCSVGRSSVRRLGPSLDYDISRLELT